MNFLRKQSIAKAIYPKRALIIYGPRRVGKTTLMNAYLSSQSEKKIFSTTGDSLAIRELFSSQSLDKLREFSDLYDIIAIDEAQQIPCIGIGIKMILDVTPEKQIILTGSSSFDLANQIGEPLTGRHFTLQLFPLAQSEMQASRFELKEALENFLVYGAYPEIMLATNNNDRERILTELVSSYLYKDILAFDNVRSSDLVRDLARLIAFQVGNEVSLHEIAVALKVDPKTVARYLDLLEKMFVIRKVRGFSRNLRNEISKKAKYYFLDNGVRNAIIGQFQPLPMRNDIGALWENFIFTEFLKRDGIAEQNAQMYFWRTHQGAEVDIIREYQGKIEAIECKWSPEAKVKKSKVFATTYPEAIRQVVHRENYLDTLIF